MRWRQSNQRLVAGVEELLNENGQRADSCLGKKPVSSASAKDSMQLLIVDDHKLFGTGLRLLIETEPGMKVVGQACNKTEALALATSEQPNLILLGLNFGGEDGLELIPDLLAAAKQTKILIVTGTKDSRTHRAAIRKGAAGLILKDSAPEVLMKAIKKVDQGELWVDRGLMSELLDEFTQANKVSPHTENIAKLTQRERGVIALIAEGMKNKQIAERLCISETTVSHHLTSIFTKLGVTDRLELVIYAFANGLAKIPR